ncbi:MAG: hypothetical protein IKB98_03315 [Clostridia bacterium]|nr:hypothetical protein [Clostridia bacterium]
MNKRLKETKQKADNLVYQSLPKCDKDGRVVINMMVKDDSDFLSVFSENQTPVISSSVAEFIENSAHALPPKSSMTLRIKSDCVDKEEREIYPKAIKEYYSEKYVANEKELVRYKVTALILAILGVLILAVAIFISEKFGAPLWSEVIDIVAWVLLWEAVDIMAFRSRNQRLLRWRYLAFIDMKVEFYNIKNK